MALVESEPHREGRRDRNGEIDLERMLKVYKESGESTEAVRELLLGGLLDRRK